MKLVHKSLTPLFSAICLLLAGHFSPATAQNPGKQPYLAFFEPAQGFKPAQSNLTDAYLQAAASLEHFGSPEPYLRHMLTEHHRIYKMAVAKMGPKVFNPLPERLSAEKVERLIANWNKLGPVLHLETIAREVGRDVRCGIRGVWDKGTIAVSMLNEHQRRVLEDMSSGKPRSFGFAQLQQKAVEELELDKAVIDTTGYAVTKRDAVDYAYLANDKFVALHSSLNKKLPPEKAAQVTDHVKSIFAQIAEMVHSELEAAILEWSLK